MRISGLAIVIICLLLPSQSYAREELPPGYQYIFPGPGAKYVHPESTLILRFENISPAELTNPGIIVQVSGDESGDHPGESYIATDNQTLIFKPHSRFESGEIVKVTVDPGLCGINENTLKPFIYYFTVLEEASVKKSQPDDEDQTTEGQIKSSASSPSMIMPNGVSVPTDFPRADITISKNPSGDHIFITTWSTNNINVIFNTSGEPVWYGKTPTRQDDFKVQANGWITMLAREGYGGDGLSFIAYNQDFEFIKSMRAGNGYTTDMHDFIMLPDNGYLLIGQRETTVDMSQYVEGGLTDATVRETCIQEFTADDQMIFIWRAWDHFDIRDLILECLTCNLIRFPHINAVDIDEDENILISSRHLSEISKIHRRSGKFIWRMSGIPDSENNEFKFERDPLNGFHQQHDIRSLGNNRYTLFDNGSGHDPSQSRALEYAVDTNRMTATLVWEYRNDFERGFVRQMGNTQRLSNGNTHINWVYGTIYPIATEVTPEGEKVFEMWCDKSSRVYRTFRFPWKGKCATPYLLLEPDGEELILIFNKFGDSNVDYYNIYGGTSPYPTSLIDTSRLTLKRLTDLQKGVHHYFRVTAVEMDGTESGYSNEEDLILRDTEPGSNLILNGDFSDSLDYWITRIDSSASAEVRVIDSVCNFVIESGGTLFNDVQLMQNNIPLISGNKYLFEFDARADLSRHVEIMLVNDNTPYTDYSRIGYTVLDPAMKHYTYSFEMKDQTDYNAYLIINTGISSKSISMDNISLKMDLSSSTLDRVQSVGEFQVYPNHPNPFSSVTHIEYSIPEAGVVSIRVFDALGRKVEEFLPEKQQAGKHSRDIQLEGHGSGIYYYTINVEAGHSGSHVQKTNRMILLK
ncbi:MAG TPA: T9SS type A sorting domain-containing protein [Bacteroides sp.]|nr:T9SS type A sorting domain-containing protein [Bacteroides sp.]